MRHPVDQPSTPASCVQCGQPMVDRPRRVIVAEWMRLELAGSGEVVDLATGYLLRREEGSGRVAVIDRRTGRPAAGVELVGTAGVAS